MPALTQSARDYENALIQNRQLQAAVEAARLEKARFDVEKAQEETLAGRVALGERIAMINERDRQAKEGTFIGQDVSKKVLAPSDKGGIGLLEGTRMQAELDLQNRMEQGRLGAIREYGIEKGILPSAKVSVGGITQTVPAEAAAKTSAQIQEDVFRVSVPRIAAGYIARGYDPETAQKLAMEDQMNASIQGERKGKITILSADGTTTKTYSDSEARMALKDPDVPESVKQQIRAFIGPEKQRTAPSWVNKSLGR